MEDPCLFWSILLFHPSSPLRCSFVPQVLMCRRTTSFFLYRLYLRAGKGSLFPGSICLFKYQKPFSEASPDHFSRISFIRTESQSAPGCGDGAISLVPTKQNLPLELEGSQESQSPSWKREMGRWWINQLRLWQGLLVGPALDVPIFWPSVSPPLRSLASAHMWAPLWVWPVGVHWEAWAFQPNSGSGL